MGEIKRERLIRATRSRAFGVRRRVAERTAERLMLDHLSAKQREEWNEGRAFHVETPDGKRRYRIAYGVAGNIRLVRCAEPLSKHGRPIREGARFCMHAYHPDGEVPAPDHMLAQKLMIESCEDEFLALANVL